MADGFLKRADGKPARILLTNDDGINAPGLVALEKIAAQLSDDILVVAPESEQSGASRSITLSKPLRMRQLAEHKYAVEGTPADCVLMAYRFILDNPPDLVLSGVNRGQNIADDVTYSGTIAGAMEGSALGIRSMALSQSYGFDHSDRLTVRWQCAEAHGAGLVRTLFGTGFDASTVMNINFPDCEPDKVGDTEVTVQGQRDQNLLNILEREDGRGRAYYWLGFRRELSNPPEGTDLRAIYDGRISITPLHLNLTQEQALAGLRDVIGN
ncbi:MAG: 5'/3'-nucleotidase SurE [Alphaproteobacteria bacterium]|nr:5'/3'-nucleotidase SurE [Alphaproteobacteria bacterium]